MAHLQYMPGDPRLVDQLVYELKSKGIFDQFRKDCIADVDTRPAYQNLRQRVENSVSTFLSRQCWKPELNKNQLREKLRKHILDGNYLEQGVERIVDQVVNPKVASVFIPQVEDLVYNYLGVPRKKNNPETSDSKTEDLLPTDLEAVSPGSVKSNDGKEDMDQDLSEDKMDIDEEKTVTKEEEVKVVISEDSEQVKEEKSPTNSFSNNLDTAIAPSETITLENIPAPDNSPPKIDKVDLEKIELPKEPYIHANLSTSDVGPDEIPLPKGDYFKPLCLNSEDESSSDSSLRRNMSPLTPIRNYNNENSCDAQQAFENDSDSKSNDKREPSSFRFAIEAKSPNSDEKEKKDDDQNKLSSQFTEQVNINAFNTPISYDDSSNSNNLHIDYESDANSKANTEKNQDVDQESQDKKDKKEERRSSHKSSHRSRDSHRHSSSKDKISDSKHSSSRDSSKHEKKKDDKSKPQSKDQSSHKEREKSKDRGDRKDSRDSSKHKSSSHKSSSHKDSKSHRSSSSHKPSDKKPDEKRSSSSHRSSSDKSSNRSSKDKKDSKPSSRDKDKKSSSKKPEDKDKKKDKKDPDDHYSLSGRGNHSRRSTDRDSNDGSSSSKGSQNQPGSRTEKKESKESSTKSSTPSSESTSPSDNKEVVTNNASNSKNQKPIRVEEHLETPIASPPRLPFVPDITLKKPKFAANLAEAKKMMKMRKFLDEEQKRMNQEAALLLEFQANVRPSLSQVYSSIPGPELEFACIPGVVNRPMQTNTNIEKTKTNKVDETGEELIDSEETDSYNENKPFSQLMDEIKEYSKASEMKKDVSIDKEEDETSIVDEIEGEKVECKIEDILKNEKEIKMDVEEKPLVDTQLMDNEIDSQHLDTENNVSDNESSTENNQDIKKESTSKIIEIDTVKDEAKLTEFEVTIITEELSETEDTTDVILPEKPTIKTQNTKQSINSENKQKHKTDNSLKYFTEQEKYEADLKKHTYTSFLKTYIENSSKSNKLFVINCDSYEENLIKEASKQFGYHEVINYYKNGHLKLPKVNAVVKDVNLTSEVSLPIEIDNYGSHVFSPVKSESSFELSSDYDAKLEEMVNKTSRQQVMEIILGNIESEDLTIEYCSESDDFNLKRKLAESESLENNNMEVVSKMRKMSDSDQISSTTEEPMEVSNNNKISTIQRSKYLGRARRVGLPKPKRTNVQNSPSSDKSIENYEQNTPTTPNGKLKITRNKVQRYDKSDLYKPKLHYLSRRNNIS